MKVYAAICALVVLVAGGLSSRSAERSPTATALPRVLLFGDLSFQSHHRHAAAALKDDAEVVVSPFGHLHTGAVHERYVEVFAGGPWDIVVLNCGLSDMMFRDPRTSELRAMSAAAGGVQVTVLDEYVQNIERLAQRLRADGSDVVWVTTLPLHPHRRQGAAVDAADIERYNAAAVERLQALSVPVVDAHGDLMAELARAKNSREADRMHNDLLKGDPSGPLVAQLRQRIAD